MTEHMFVLGIDPGLSTTGYGIVSAGPKPAAIAAGVIRTDPSLRLADRLLELHRDLVAVIDDFRPATAAIEQVFVNRNLRTATSVARASGVALLAMASAGLRVTEYTPSAIKMALTGFGAADKRQVQQVVAMRLGLETAPTPADAADALAIALCHVQAARMQQAVGGAR
jgi:crossover junction endodeoxyribonuclease RuvC